MNNKMITLILSAIIIVSGFIYLNYVRGIYVILTNIHTETVENIEISCKGFKQTITLSPNESKRIKLNFNYSGDNSLSVNFSQKEKIIKDNFSYFENFSYKGTIELELEEGKIKLVKDTVSPSLL